MDSRPERRTAAGRGGGDHILTVGIGSTGFGRTPTKLDQHRLDCEKRLGDRRATEGRVAAYLLTRDEARPIGAVAALRVMQTALGPFYSDKTT
jgi:hypothetical protein